MVWHGWSDIDSLPHSNNEQYILCFLIHSDGSDQLASMSRCKKWIACFFGTPSTEEGKEKAMLGICTKPAFPLSRVSASERLWNQSMLFISSVYLSTPRSQSLKFNSRSAHIAFTWAPEVRHGTTHTPSERPLKPNGRRCKEFPRREWTIPAKSTECPIQGRVESIHKVVRQLNGSRTPFLSEIF